MCISWFFHIQEYTSITLVELNSYWIGIFESSELETVAFIQKGKLVAAYLIKCRN
jgi:hypothetical protein